jgi:replicative DNA helicase
MAPQMTAEPVANIEAEQALLGAVLFDNAALELAGDVVKADHFYEPFHQRLFAALEEVIRSGARAEPILMMERFRRDPGFEELGGLRYLADLVDRAPPAANAADYAQAVAELGARRDLAKLAHEIHAEALADPEGLGGGLLQKAERSIAELANRGPARHQWKPGARVIREAIASARSRGGRIDFPTGLASVDMLLGGFAAGELSIIAGRPGMGKSVVATTVARANAAVGRATLLFSQEMADEPLGLRLACDVAYERQAVQYSGYGGQGLNPTYDGARKGLLSPEQWARLEEAAEVVQRWPLHFDTRPGLTVSHMEACALRAFRHWERQGIERGPVVIDHLGIVKPERDRGGSKPAETGDISRALAAMAKRLGVPVVCLCQINRQSEGRQDKRPELSDLRWSGDIEADARQVVLLYRPEYHYRPPLDPNEEDPTERAEREVKLGRMRNRLFWIIAKANNGPTGMVETFCDIACSAARDRDPDPLERAA